MPRLLGVRFNLPSCWSSGALVLLLSGEAAAGQLEAPHPEPLIYEGEPAGLCEWAAVPAFNSNQTGCSAVLIHPQMIATAGHCTYFVSNPSLLWGENAFVPSQSFALEYCWTAESYNTSLGVHQDDVAFCKLASPVDLPYFPPAFGCELELVTAGAQVVVVGYGEPNTGQKRWRSTELLTDATVHEMALLGNEGSPTCHGDSGGPALLQLPDGSWRVFAVTSGGDACGEPFGYTYSAWLHRWIPWVELQSGIDLTPCHDADGTWNPTPLCRGFVVDPFDPGNADWSQWCAGAPVSGAGESCGPAAVDDDPPSAAIVSPSDQSVFDPPAAEIDIVIEADDGPWPIATVELLVDGESVATDSSAPWEFAQAEFPQGTWTLVARATDLSGNVGESEPVQIHVGDPPPNPDGETGETGETGEPGFDDEDQGCACTTRPGAGGATSVLVLGLLLLGWRRSGGSATP